MILFIIFAPRLFLISVLSIAALSNPNVVDNAQTTCRHLSKRIKQFRDSLLDHHEIEKVSHLFGDYGNYGDHKDHQDNVIIQEPEFQFDALKSDIEGIESDGVDDSVSDTPVVPIEETEDNSPDSNMGSGDDGRGHSGNRSGDIQESNAYN